MQYKRFCAVGLVALMLLSGMEMQRALAKGESTAAPTAITVESLQNVSVALEKREEGKNYVLIPTLSGHPDASMQAAINSRIAERLRIDELLRMLDRTKKWSNDEGAASGLQMEGHSAILGSMLSLTVAIRGALLDGGVGQMYETFNCDLLTGQEVQLADLFAQPEQAFSGMEEIVQSAAERDGLNAYLVRAEVTPLPREAFSVDAQGLTLYYPWAQYRLISGASGTVRFLYYQLKEWMKQSPITQALLAAQTIPNVPAEQLRADIAAGQLPGIPAKLGTPMREYIDGFRLVAEPDYTLDGPLYQFEAPQMQGIRLSSATYPEDPNDTSEAVINIRATQIDLYGLHPGVSTMPDVLDLLGQPDWTTELDADAASDMLLVPGKSFWYTNGGNTLEMHGDEDQVLSAVILHAGATRVE